MKTNKAVLRASASEGEIASIVTDQPVPTSMPSQPGKNGRPSKYKDEYDEMLLDFFDIEVHRIIDVQIRCQSGELKTVQKTVLNTFPTFGRFASNIRVSRDTLYYWAKEKNADGTLRHPGFSYTYTRARDLQAALLIEGGLAGAYDVNFACKMAQCLLGWRHKPKSEPEVKLNGALTEKLAKVYEDGVKEAMEQKEQRRKQNTQQSD